MVPLELFSFGRVGGSLAFKRPVQRCVRAVAALAAVIDFVVPWVRGQASLPCGTFWVPAEHDSERS